jgi:thiosulfate/3-mercaptopyruvate sulfurtransferase
MPVSVIRPEALALLLKERGRDVAVIDARRPNEYAAGHIEGAHFIGWEDWCRQAPGHLPQILHQPGYWGTLDEDRCGQMAAHLSALGVSRDTLIVVYANGIESRGREGRVAWMLLYLGAENVCLLDGGLPAWQQRRLPVTQTPPPLAIAAGDFQLNIQEKRRLRHGQLKALDKTGQLPLLIDTRSESEYIGRSFPYMPRLGRIPGAVLLPFCDLQVMPPEMGLGREMLAYCEVGVRAGLAVFLHEVYTGVAVPVYDGSMMEWGQDMELTVQIGGG